VISTIESPGDACPGLPGKEAGFPSGDALGGRPRFRGVRVGSLDDALSEATSLTTGGLLLVDAFGGRPRFLGAGACCVRQ